MSLSDARPEGIVHVVYTDGEHDIPTGVEPKPNYLNWTSLQAALHWTLVKAEPSTFSLSEAASKDPKESALALTINVRQRSPARDNCPITFCAANTILNDGNPSIRVLMTADGPDGTEKYLLGDPLFGVHMRYAEPKSDDWKTELPFVTIPPGPEGLTVTKYISWGDLVRRGGKPVAAERQPRAGDEYKLSLSGGRRGPFTDWWNWGDLEGDLKDRKLVNMVDPKVNGVENPEQPPWPILLPFEAWGEFCDEDGNDWVRLLNIMDTTPLIVNFVD